MDALAYPIVLNDAGGRVYKIPAIQVIDRVVAMGYVATYYCDEDTARHRIKEFLQNHAASLGSIIASRAAYLSYKGKIHRPETAAAVLAGVLRYGGDEAKEAVVQLLPVVARTMGHLLYFVKSYTELSNSAPRSFRRAVQRWFDVYSESDQDWLAFQATKYMGRHGISTKDVLMLAHPRPSNANAATVFKFMLDRQVRAEGDIPPSLAQWSYVQSIKDENELASLIEREGARIPWEWINTENLTPRVWRALLPHLPIHALLRNIRQLAQKNVITAQYIERRLNEVDRLLAKRVHPINLLLPLFHLYKATDLQDPIVRVLDRTLYEFLQRFHTAKDKPFVIYIDESGSMRATHGHTKITLHDMAIGFAAPFLLSESAIVKKVSMFTRPFPDDLLKQARAEKSVLKLITEQPVGYGTNLVSALDDATRITQGLESFILVTDNESWAHHTPPHVAVATLSKKHPGISCISMAMTATENSIFPSDHPRCFNVVGFSTSAAEAIDSFIAGAKNEQSFDLMPPQQADDYLRQMLSGKRDVASLDMRNAVDAASLDDGMSLV